MDASCARVLLPVDGVYNCTLLRRAPILLPILFQKIFEKFSGQQGPHHHVVDDGEALPQIVVGAASHHGSFAGTCTTLPGPAVLSSSRTRAMWKSLVTMATVLMVVSPAAAPENFAGSAGYWRTAPLRSAAPGRCPGPSARHTWPGPRRYPPPAPVPRTAPPGCPDAP